MDRRINGETVMFNKTFIIIIVIILSPVIAFADYEITWYSIDGGGGSSASSTYSLTGSIGQSDPGLVSSGPYTQDGGFWAGSYGCIVNLTDLAIFCQQWLQSGTDLTADFDASGDVDIIDFAELAYWWYNTCPAGWSIK